MGAHEPVTGLHPERSRLRRVLIRPDIHDDFTTAQDDQASLGVEFAVDGAIAIELDKAAIIELEASLLTGAAALLGKHGRYGRVVPAKPGGRADRRQYAQELQAFPPAHSMVAAFEGLSGQLSGYACEFIP
ncbi:hypothetical protein RS1P1_04980 [Pseudomonas moraviensis]|nr:hypothetical protein RS1P1_04980 [Pseudomonas moraviensis]